MTNPIFVAIDTIDLEAARDLAARLAPHVGGLKLGLEFFCAHGPAGIAQVADGRESDLFLDLKLHDIPNTVAGAVRAVRSLKPDFLTLHAGGGAAMMAAARDAAGDTIRLLGVTVLTSLDDDDLASVGQIGPALDQAMRLARFARESGLDGVVCSPREVALIRAECGPDFLIVVPGIRPEGATLGDQKRVMTPRAAIEAGASRLVIGRPITGADDPAAAARAIIAGLRP
jgi:orotidine-5'-phosphate decarboxylase